MVRFFFRQGLLSVIFLGAAFAADVSVSFVQPGAPMKQDKTTTELELFMDQPAALTWRMSALPNTQVFVRGRVFQAASSIAVPLNELAFEVKMETAGDHVQAEAAHVLALPQSGRPAAYLIQWQAVSGETVAGAGTVRLRLSPRGILTPLQCVSLTAEKDLESLVGELERDQVQVVRLKDAGLPAAWQGILIAKASPAEVEKIKGMALEHGQDLILFGDLPGMPATILAKQAGRGRLLILPTSRLGDFATNPALQRLAVEFCQPAATSNSTVPSS